MHYYTDVLKKYAVFEGRARRKEYWMFVLINFLVGILVAIVGSILGVGEIGNSNLLSVLYSLAVLLPNLAVGARRLHDTNRSGWWLLLYLIPIVGWIVLIVFLVSDSKPGTNQYGPNPKEIVAPSPSTAI